MFLLSLVVMAVLAGATSLSGIRRWATGVGQGVLTVLARGGPAGVPVVSTLSRLLARLDGDVVDDAFARYTAAVLAPGDPDPFPQNLFAEPDDIAEPTGTPEHTGTVEVAGTAEHTDTVEVADTVGRGGGVAAGAVLRVASLDGKGVRAAVTATGKAPYLVSVFPVGHENRCRAGVRSTPTANEVTAFRAVFDVLADRAGHVVVT